MREDEFHAVAFLLSWHIIVFAKWNNALQLRIQHEASIVELRFVCATAENNQCTCAIGPVGYLEKLRGNANTLTMYELIQHFRQYYCREYAITIWKTPKKGYTVIELNTLSDLLLKIIF